MAAPARLEGSPADLRFNNRHSPIFSEECECHVDGDVLICGHASKNGFDHPVPDRPPLYAINGRPC